MNNLEQNALKIAKLLNPNVALRTFWKQDDIYKFSHYDGLMPIVFECNYEQDDLDIEIVIYGSGLDVHLDDEDILITTFDTKEGFIEAIQLACIKYLEIKNEH